MAFTMLAAFLALAAQAASNSGSSVAAVEPPTASRCVAISPGNPQYEPLRKVCDFALHLKLPDFICDETAHRFISNTKHAKWKKVDVVTAEVTYENGWNERYSNIAINGRRLKTTSTLSSYELEIYLNSLRRGTWASGPFGGDLARIFWPGSQARFELRAKTGGSTTAIVFDFQIDKANSPFSLITGSNEKRTIFRVGAEGSIWIDKATSRLIRVEIRYTQIDKRAPVTLASSVVDYGETSIGNLGPLLVPLASEFLACDSFGCGRTVMSFQNWRKFASEVRIILEK